MKPRLILSIAAVVFLAGCSLTSAPTPTIQPTLASTETILVLPSPTVSPIPPTPTNTLALPTVAVPTVTNTVVVSTPGSQMVQIYLIAIGDNGVGGPMIGCGDSAIAVQVQIEPTQAVLRAALTKLLSIKDQFYGQSGLYNSLYQSNLQLADVAIANGKATVMLTGTLQLGGECDSPRVEEQLERTVLQFSTVTSADIFLNGVPLAEALSLK